jgi:outer membrane receptor protein involved in Fe transport
MNLDFKQSTNYTYNSYAGIMVPLGEKTSSWSEEIRAVSDYDFPVNFTVGGYYGGEHRTNYTNGFLGFVGVDPVTGKVETYDNIARNGGTTLSAFAELRIKPRDDIEIAGGARYTQEWKDTDQQTTYINPILAGPFLLRPVGDPLSGHYTDNNWSPEATVTWRPSDDLTVYAAYKTGYKSGGFSAPNLLQTVQTSDNAKFASEDSWGYELGLKTYFDDRKGRAELTFYNYVFNNLQVSEFDQQTITYFIRNAAAARTQGIELSGQYLPLPGLTLNGSANYNDAHYLSFPSALCYPGQILNGVPCATTGGHQSLSGASLNDAPKWTLTAGFDYEFPVTDDWAAGINADSTYYSAYWTIPDHSPLSLQSGYFLVNVGARLHTTDDQWELAFIGRNITDQPYQISGSDTPFAIPGIITTYTPRFRELRLQVTWRYQ